MAVTAVTTYGAAHRGRSAQGYVLESLLSGPRGIWVLSAVAVTIGAALALSPVVTLGVIAVIMLLVILERVSRRLRLRWTEIFLHVLVTSVFFESVGPDALTAGRFLALVAVVALGWRVLYVNEPFPPHFAIRSVPVLLLLFSYVISGFWAESFSGFGFALFQMALAMAFYLSFALLPSPAHAQERVRPLLKTFVCGALIAGVIGLVQWAYISRAEGLQGDPNIYAMYQVMAFAGLLSLSRDTTGRARLAWLCGIPILLGSILASGSRGAIVALLPTMVLCVFLLAPRRRWMSLLVPLALGGAFMVVLSLLTNSRASNVADEQASGRIDIWHVAWQSGLEHPFSGLGAGNFKPASIGLLESVPGVELIKSHLLLSSGIEVHNLYLEAFVERGLPGLLALVLVLVCGFVLLFRARTRAYPAIDALVPMLFAFSTATFFLSIANNKLLWLLLGLAVLLPRGDQSDSDVPSPTPDLSAEGTREYVNH